MKRHCWPFVCGTLAMLLGACTPSPDFTDATGRQVLLSDFAGKPLLVNYFAPWCAPCLREMPRLAALHREGKIGVIAIDYDSSSPAGLSELARQHGITVPLLIPRDEASLPFPKPTMLPTSYLLDGNGKVRETLVGELDDARITALKQRVE